MTAWDTGFEQPGPARSLAQIDQTLGSANSALALAQGAVRTLVERTISQCRGTLVACQDQVATTVEAELTRQGIALDAIKSSLRAWLDATVSSAFEYLGSIPGAKAGRQMASRSDQTCQTIPPGAVVPPGVCPHKPPPSYETPPPCWHWEWLGPADTGQWTLAPDPEGTGPCSAPTLTPTDTSTVTVTPTVTSTTGLTSGYTLVQVTAPAVTVAGGGPVIVPPPPPGPPLAQPVPSVPSVPGGGPPVAGGGPAGGVSGGGAPLTGGGVGAPPPCLPPAPPAPGWTITGVTTDALGCQQFTYGPITPLGPPIGPSGPPHISFGPPPPPPPIGGGGIIQFGPPPPPPPLIGGPGEPCPITVNVAPTPPCPAPPIQVTCPTPTITNVVNVTPIGTPGGPAGGVGAYPDLGPLTNLLLNPGSFDEERKFAKKFYGPWLDEFYSFQDDQALQDIKNAAPPEVDVPDLYVAEIDPES